MDLIIVESPTKAKTISKFLGKDYQVESSFGHVRDLPKSSLGVDVDNNFEPKYLVPAKAKPVIKHLKSLLSKSQQIILATDEDREGEAIAWHLAQALDLESQRSPARNATQSVAGEKVKGQRSIQRIVFHEITKTAIEKALANPREIDYDQVDAQQARRVLDRIVGYKLSPFLWQKIARRLSAGRVQSVAVRLIVEREEEIRKFKSDEYWTITTLLSVSHPEPFNHLQGKLREGSIEANLVKIGDKVLDKLDIKTKNQADEIVADLEKASYQITNIESKETSRHPSPPFTTSTLQQAAANRLHFSAKKTMLLAQRLYENGQITYMRTDSVNLSPEATAAAKRWLRDNLGEQYASAAPRQFQTKTKGAQEAHEAIRPTNIGHTPDDLKTTETDENRLYKLIWQRFVASQMPSAKIATAAADILANQKSKIPNSKLYSLRATGQQLLFDGFLKIWPQKFEEKELPMLKISENLDLQKVTADQHFTEPPPRYNEASLVKTLEKHGIGRPSTYAPIISVIQERDYVEKEDRRFKPTPMGEVVNGVLVKHFSHIVDIGFTAEMEGNLDKIAAGKKDWRKVIGDFYQPFIKNLEEKYKEVERVAKPEPEPTDEKCDLCGKPMVIRSGRFGKFLACSGFPECKNTKKIVSVDGAVKAAPKSTGIKCDKCGQGELVQRFTRKGHRPFWGCSRYPDCDNATWTNPQQTQS